MCGICGSYGADFADSAHMLEQLAHRGPDGQGAVFRHQTYLGHTRLAIVDVAGGQQPICDEHGWRWLVCNGEIYNHPQLRQQFADYPYKTSSDSEDILAVYEEFGVGTPRQLTGMFAFALLDDGELFLARDPLGIKPLYYGWRDDTLFFASEIKALYGVVDAVLEFPPGYWYSSRLGFVRYYDLQEIASQTQEPASPQMLHNYLRRSVESHLMADVRVGVFLSGGLDSSIIAALTREGISDLYSFAVGIESSPDLHYARHAADFLGTHHFEYIYTPAEMIAALPEVIYYLESFDPALVRSAIPNYFLARLASEHVTVILSGEGADELFSGYAYLKQFQDSGDLHQELTEITAELHNRNLQRLDRMTMAHSLEGRVPFLDTEFVEFAFQIPTEDKFSPGRDVEKWILRKAFEDALPEQIVWRTKEKFSKGAGSAYIVEHLVQEQITDAQFTLEAQQVFQETGHRIRSKEELYYYRIFQGFFDPSIIPLVGFSRSL
jgi:asparagine synthase (glutamine-hydrolysing)